jgi:hypothetical protein
MAAVGTTAFDVFNASRAFDANVVRDDNGVLEITPANTYDGDDYGSFEQNGTVRWDFPINADAMVETGDVARVANPLTQDLQVIIGVSGPGILESGNREGVGKENGNWVVTYDADTTGGAKVADKGLRENVLDDTSKDVSEEAPDSDLILILLLPAGTEATLSFSFNTTGLEAGDELLNTITFSALGETGSEPDNGGNPDGDGTSPPNSAPP